MSKNINYADKYRAIILYYIDFSVDVSIKTVRQVMNKNYYNFYDIFDDTVKIIIIPTFYGNYKNHIEYINKCSISDVELELINKIINNYDSKNLL